MSFEGSAVTLSGEQSYVSLVVNSQLLVLGDVGSIFLRTVDKNGVIIHVTKLSSDILTLELVNGTVYLRAMLSEGKTTHN